MHYYHLTKNFRIVYKENFISSPVIKQKIHLIFIHNPLLNYKMHFYRQKLPDPPLAATADHQNYSWWRHIDKCIAIIYLLKTYRGGFSNRKITFDCKYVSFCIEFIRLGIAYYFLFQTFPCFYVMSQSTFPDKIRPRPLISCPNCAANRPENRIILTNAIIERSFVGNGRPLSSQEPVSLCSNLVNTAYGGHLTFIGVNKISAVHAERTCPWKERKWIHFY